MQRIIGLRGRLSGDQHDLLVEVLDRRAPQLTPAVRRSDGEVSLTDLRAIERALAIEFAANGLADDSEPNQHGLRLESLLDVVLETIRKAEARLECPAESGA